MKNLLWVVLIVSLAVIASFGQQASQVDPIKGTWKLNVEKSSSNRSAPESEVITIVKQESGYKLTFDTKQSNGYNPKYDVVTTMKGETVKPVNADGRGTNDTWSVTRKGPNAFEMELKTPFGGWTDQYEVSADGKSLSLHRIMGKNNRLVGGDVEKDGALRQAPQYVLAFDRAE